MKKNLKFSDKVSQFRKPAEWEKKEAVWLAFPSEESLWQENLGGAQKEFLSFCQALASDPLSEKLHILIDEKNRLKKQKDLFCSLPEDSYRLYYQDFGDIWLRDTGPIFTHTNEGERIAQCFSFNGWGEKFLFPADQQVAEKIGFLSESKIKKWNFILEGGAIEGNGEEACITTRQCLLNPNRHLGKTQDEVEKELFESLGMKTFFWIENGLLHDHTDGHVDNIARFISPRKILCMISEDPHDPQATVLKNIYEQLSYQVHHLSHGAAPFEVFTLPSPGKVMDSKKNILPASYLNFYIGNRMIIVPLFQSCMDSVALEKIQFFFPDYRVVGMYSNYILTGGGSFHCMSKEQPAWGRKKKK